MSAALHLAPIDPSDRSAPPERRTVIQNIDVLKQLFETMMKEQTPQYLPLAKGWDDKAKERAIDYFQDKERPICRN